MEGKLLLTTPAKKFECQGEPRGMREGVVGARDPRICLAPVGSSRNSRVLGSRC
jgi:hypothetical protein